MEETAKAMGLSEGATTKMREYFKKAHDLMKEKGDFHTKTDEEKKKWVEDSIVAIQAEVDEADKELVAKVVHAAHVSYHSFFKCFDFDRNSKTPSDANETIVTLQCKFPVGNLLIDDGVRFTGRDAEEEG